jgi:hypothetical protein
VTQCCFELYPLVQLDFFKQKHVEKETPCGRDGERGATVISS